MGVTTNLINKPFNPRGNDQSPLAFNKAAIYSGKALDFDGVNDTINVGRPSYMNITNGAITLACYARLDSTAANGHFFRQENGTPRILFAYQAGALDGISFGTYDGSAYSELDIALEPSEKSAITNDVCFVVATQDTNGTRAIYLNGVLIGSDTRAQGVTCTNTGDLHIGSAAGGGEFWDGLIANAKLFDVALTPAQIADLYNFPEKIVPTGVANTALKLWLPMQEGAGTTAINGAPDALGSELVTNGDFASNINDWAAKDSTIIWDNGKLKCDNSSGNGSGGPRQNVGLQNSKTYIFTATIQLVSASANGTFSLFTSTGVGTGQSSVYTGSTLVAGGDAITETGQFTTGTDGDVSIQFYVDRSSAVYTVDNVSVKELTNFGTISGATYVNGIGAPVAQTAVIDWNKHTLDGTNTVLIPQGLTSGRDLLGNLFTNVRKQGALNLDGNSWAEVHDNASLDIGDLSLEAWVKFEKQGTYQVFFAKDDSGSDRSYELFLNGTESQFGSNIFGGGYLFNTQTINDNQWYHVVATFTDSTNAFVAYVNGAQNKSATISASQNDTDAPLIIGAWYNKSQFMTHGQIAQPRIYNRALTAEEVQRNYDAGKNIYTN